MTADFGLPLVTSFVTGCFSTQTKEKTQGFLHSLKMGRPPFLCVCLWHVCIFQGTSQWNAAIMLMETNLYFPHASIPVD